jgi:cation:H+ antiporter
MLEDFFFGLPLYINGILILIALYVVIRASHHMVDGAVYIAREMNVSPLVIGATVVAMGTSSAELAVNLVVVLGGLDTSTVVGNILGSNLVNIGIELGVSALVAGLIIIPREALEKDIPLYFAATGFLAALIIDGEIKATEAVLMLAMFIIAVVLIIQYARVKDARRVLVVDVSPIEEISHPAALQLTRRRAFINLLGGLVVLVLASRLLILNTEALAVAVNIPKFIIGLMIIGPGTSLPEIASSIQAARKGHGDLVLGTAFGSNLFNLLFGLGLPALIRPLVISNLAIQSFIFMGFVNMSLLALILSGHKWLGRPKSINRLIGVYLVVTYVGFLSYLLVDAVGGTLSIWWQANVIMVLVAAMLVLGYRFFERSLLPRMRGEVHRVTSTRILCATRGGMESQPTHTQAIKIAQEQNAELIFFYVFDKNALPRAATPLVIDVEAQTRHMNNYLARTAQTQALQAGVASRIIVRAGSLREQLAKVARDEDVDLVILGNPAEKSSLFKREALNTLAADIEDATGAKVLALLDDSEDST